MNNYLSAIASTIVLAAGVLVLVFATDKGQAWTAESARRLAVQRSPIALPPLAVNSTEGTICTLGDVATNPPLVLLELIYTRCPTICQTMGAEFAAVQSRLAVSGHFPNVRLVSISFDPADDLRAMAGYGARYLANPRWWTLGVPVDHSQLDRVRHIIGSIAIPEPSVGFIHNAAIYAIYQGKVVAILDHDDHAGINKVIDRYAGAMQVKVL